MSSQPLSMRRGRGLAPAFLLATLAWLATLGGCVMPPVVMDAHDPEWTLKESRYPLTSRVVEVATDGPYLRGLYVPSDVGAPLVVHFAPAGCSVTRSLARNDQYGQLAHLGFASLAIDYRGVGLSDGIRDTAAVGRDAAAIYARALALVDGDASRLVLRGCSLGTMAIAELLAGGRQPAAVILFAPVFSDSVVLAFGYAVYNDLLVTLGRPFLRAVPLARLPEALATFEGDLLVVGHPSDELLTPTEFAELERAVLRRAGTMIAKKSAVFPGGDDPVLVALREHIRVSIESLSVGPDEAAFLAARFPDAPDVDTRVAAALAQAAPGLRAELDASPAARERLGALARTCLLPPNLMLAAALGLDETAPAESLLRGETNHAGRTALSRLDPQSLRAVLDLRDPAGPIDPLALRFAHHQLALLGWDELELRGAARIAGLLDLTDAVHRAVDDGAPARSATRPRRFDVENERIVDREADSPQGVPVLFLRQSFRGDDVDRRRQIFRTLCKGAGLADHVRTAPEHHLVDVTDGEDHWTVDCRTLEIAR